MKKMSSYKKLDFPNCSKSNVKSLNYCKYSFYDEEVLGHEQESREDAIEGTNLHTVFAMFYKDFKEVATEDPGRIFDPELINPLTQLKKHPFRKFVYEACLNYVKPDQRHYGKYKNILNNFASIETRNWLRLNTILHNQTEIRDCFVPLALEHRFHIEALHLYGTIDRVGIEVLPGGQKKVCVYEYKTGNVPSAIKKHVDVGNMFDWKVPTHYMKEIHFYTFCYLLLSGWSVTDEVKTFLEDKDWWYATKNDLSYAGCLKEKKDYITSLQKKYKLYKEGKILSGSDILLGYYFLNGGEGYKPLKKFNYRSFCGVLSSINEYRSVVHNEAYVKHPIFVFDDYVCSAQIKNCAKFEDCKEKVVEYQEEQKRKQYSGF